MPGRTSIALSGIILCISTYAIALVIYTTMIAKHGSGCIYAVLVDSDHRDAKNFTWEPYNSTLVYTPLGNKLPLDGGFGGFSDVCNTYLINATDLFGRASHASAKSKIRSVVGTRNCAAYFWKTHIQALTFSLSSYIMFCVIREWRRMFGVVRSENDRIPPTTYTKNYTARVIANGLLKTVYTRMSEFMCEITIYKNSMCRIFTDDPISFILRHPLAAILLITERLIRLGAQCLCVLTVSIFFVPCKIVLSKWFLSITGVFLGIVICTEMGLLIDPGPAEKPVMFAEVAPAPKTQQNGVAVPFGAHAVCSNCCASIISSIVIKVLYVLFMVTLIVTLVRYERALQIALFGRAYLP
ncbi:UL53 protein [Gallid alphaherpesvirus 3]|uniref:Envelope glycoprotein K n=1 Tax=Gallid alphaherpesvirus 3 TaxID=35250 RepID=F8TC52_9ALPH|nr:UL53 protein [Gallid alphaherpesvirus 3]AEI00263.1 UL53 protein [Gallid alphaherpesvirus 3]QEY02251.1 UL53 protein [Gallid alphaherpesvirus 3]